MAEVYGLSAWNDAKVAALIYCTTDSSFRMVKYGATTASITLKDRFMTIADSSRWITTALALKANVAAPTITGIAAFTGSVKIAKKTVAAGDSVLGNMYLRSSDSVLVMWSGSAWITVKDLNPLR